MIELQNVTKTYRAGTVALRNISLSVHKGEFVFVVGSSGSGKTTLLRLIAGLDFPDRGEIVFDGEESTNRKARERGVGFVFQHYSLFRHMTVFDNIAFGLSVKPRSTRPSKEQIRSKVNELLGLVQLDSLASRYPSQLSGGQRQRVALARALAVEPKVLLLDEPFGALDAKVRKELRSWLRRLHDEIHVTSVFVTHDQEEALEVADRIVVMNQGRVVQQGAPETVYHEPANAFVYNFLGSLNLFHARIENGDTYIGDPAANSASAHKTPMVYVRPHLMHIERYPFSHNHFPGRIVHINPAGPIVKVELETERGHTIQVELSHDRFQELRLLKDDVVFVSPLEMRVF